jgi:hypothetical protein
MPILNGLEMIKKIKDIRKDTIKKNGKSKILLV